MAGKRSVCTHEMVGENVGTKYNGTQRYCKACSRERQHEWYEANKDRIIEERRQVRAVPPVLAPAPAAALSLICCDCDGPADGTRYALSTDSHGNIIGTPICLPCADRKHAAYLAWRASKPRVPRKAPMGDRGIYRGKVAKEA